MEGAVGTHRLIVTDNCNASLKRRSLEVLWKALLKSVGDRGAGRVTHIVLRSETGERKVYDISLSNART